MRRFWLPLLALLSSLVFAPAVHAQAADQAQTVSACGTPNNTPVVGNVYAMTQDTTGKLCTSASGGGGGGGAVFGPTAVGSAAANPPIIVGGTANATATGTVQVDKVDSGGDQFVNIAEVGGSAIALGQAAKAASLPVTLDTTSTTAVTNAGTFAVQCSACIGTTGGTVGLVAGSAIVGKVGIDQTTPGTTNGVQVNAALPAGTNLIGATNNDYGGSAASVNNGTTDATTQRVTLSSDSTGQVKLTTSAAIVGFVEPLANGTGANGLSNCFLLATASTNSTLCKNSSGNVYHISVFNNSGTVAYLHMTNTSSAPTCSSATTVDEVMVPANGGVEKDEPMGVGYTTGIGFCFTGGIASGDTTSVAATTYLINVYYK